MEDLDTEILALNKSKSVLEEQMNKLNWKKHEIAQVIGNLDATDDDLVEVNAGEKIVVAKQSTLTQIPGTRLEALFRG
jgi:hypothetical protein